MNQTLIEALVNDLPFVRNLHSRIEKLERKNNKLKEKRLGMNPSTASYRLNKELLYYFRVDAYLRVDLII